ncbi:hypothetical protein DWY73_02745 [Bacteroides fragilis]|uniref:Uncharacterized protein n=2 Tax=Bacteroides fragilis TaxID=817 RepID=D1JMQ1_BACFG|nr:hypothetical protein HMPREF0101_01252 [Bacteroides fragilis]BAD48876.1 hypothetical protein BF2129 [Bacteroides fragilis YCH46]KAA4701400.1 hypothetical protein F3B28_06145 [Bacteroides fragilis]KAA4708078.1 hypothetical protein F3B27_11330 [Bacteroides fragilis]KAA4719732.1 hypothetical protein F3B32_08540 [Bacteroides fragilis]
MTIIGNRWQCHLFFFILQPSLRQEFSNQKIPLFSTHDIPYKSSVYLLYICICHKPL